MKQEKKNMICANKNPTRFYYEEKKNKAIIRLCTQN